MNLLRHLKDFNGTGKITPIVWVLLEVLFALIHVILLKGLVKLFRVVAFPSTHFHHALYTAFNAIKIGYCNLRSINFDPV
jgi:hypothetical protein